MTQTIRLLTCILAAAASLSLHAQIASIEINQGIGVQKNGARKFVAGKDTVIRAFLESATTIDPSQSSALIVRDGTEIARIPPIDAEGPVSVVDFLCPSRDACGEWAAGSYRFDVTVNGATKSTEGTDYAFVPRGQIRVLAVPVTANYGGVVVSVTDDRWKNFGDFVRKNYPVANDHFVWATRGELDASGSEFDLETEQGRLNLWEALAKLIPQECANTPNADGCFNQVFGFIMARPNGYPNGNLQGYTYGKPANIGVITDEDAPATVAHEIGHTYGLGDTYDGGSFACDVNPAPDAFAGKKFDDHTQEARCASGRVALQDVSATLVPAAHHPYEIGGRRALGDVGEYMGSSGAQRQFWTSQDAWDHVFDQLQPTPATGTESSLRIRGEAAAEQRFIQCWGVIRRNATQASDVQMDPCWSYLDTDPLPDTIGPWMLAAVDASGTRLATGAFDPEFSPVAPKGLPPALQERAPFEADLSFPAGTVKFQVIRDGNVIAELPVSANAPAITNVAPQAVGTVDGEVMITWSGTDADGNTLWYAVEFNPDVDDPQSEWLVLMLDLDEPRFLMDFSELPGGPNAQLRVSATDGVHTVSADSGRFAVAAKPPAVFLAPLDKLRYELGEEIILYGEAYDLQDEEFDDENLVWSSNISGRLGDGPLLVLSDLPAGYHRISLTATNSEGKSASAEEVVVVAKPIKRRSIRK